jgi:ABC-type polysaccharide/polyol phosphate export permease
MLRAGVALIMLVMVAMSTLVCAFVILSMIFKLPRPFEWSEISLPLVLACVLQLLGSFGLAVALLGTRRFREIANALENFEEYDAAYKKKWGP